MHSEFVYVLKAGAYYKIGRTTNIERRTGQIALQMPFDVELFKVINTDNAAVLEAMLHLVCASERVNGEWFLLSDDNALRLWMHPSSFSMEKLRRGEETHDASFDAWGVVAETLREIVKRHAESGDAP